jgi:Skp family chaperone for outer membrane proteins
MKKLLFVCVAIAAGFLFTNQSSAQQVKIGYFDEQSILPLMPGIQKVDTLLRSFSEDSLKQEYDYTLSLYMRQDSIWKKDSATMPAKARELAQRDLNTLKIKLIRWQEYSNGLAEQKKEELLAPYLKKIVDALHDVVVEQKYSYVLRQDALYPYVQPPLLDNLTIRVAMKLKLTIPKELEDEWKRQLGGGAPSNRPATGVKPKG